MKKIGMLTALTLIMGIFALRHGAILLSLVVASLKKESRFVYSLMASYHGSQEKERKKKKKKSE